MGKSSVDLVWILVCTSLVFIMQAGFLCMEAGLTRSKNSINVAIKNLLTFGAVTIFYWIWGYGFTYGSSHAGWVGISDFLPDFSKMEASQLTFFIYQLMFCATSVVIISGAVAERIRFSSYLVVACLAAGLIYPLCTHWVNNGADTSAHFGWLGKKGFIDFAGSTTVHSVGGWVSLAALIVLGPRKGRFVTDPSTGKTIAKDISGSNLPFALLGVMLLFFGWIGFNGGSTLGFTPDVPKIIATTLLAGVSGMLTALIYSWFYDGRPHVLASMNGALAGMVAITANSNSVSGWSVLVLGGVGAIIALLTDQLLIKLRLDDAVGAIGVHLAAGIWGTLGVGLFSDLAIIKTGLTRMEQIEAQCIGIATAAVWAFGVSYILLRIFDRFFPMRVDAHSEEIGLNVSEHEAETEWVTLLAQMDQQSVSGDWSQRMNEEPFTEVGQIAHKYNQVLGAFQKSLIQGRNSAQLASLGQMAGGIAHEINNPLMAIQSRADQLQTLVNRNLLDPKLISEFSADIASTSARIANVVKSLKTVARGSRQQKFEKKVMKDLLEETLSLCRTRFSNNEIEIKTRLEPANLEFECNPTEITQILINLLNNAVDALDDVAEKWVSLEVTLSGDIVEIKITDSGPGISKDIRDNLFEPFYSTKAAGKGTGLGLSLCRSFAENHGGQIFVDASQKHTCFVLRIPKTKKAA